LNLSTRVVVAVTLLIVVALSVPLWAGEYWTHVAIIAYYYVVVASSWNLLTGYAGQMSFAHVTLVTVGAYASTLIALRTGLHPLFSMAIGAGVAASVGLVLGVLCLRMRGLYHSLTTLAFAEAFRTVLNLEYKVTRGPMGLQSVPLFLQSTKTPYYFAALGLACVVLFVLWRVVRSPVGITLQAIREDQTAAAVAGVNIAKYKLATFAVVGGLAGFAGAFLAHYILIVTPDWATQTQMALVITMAIMGGLGTFAGPILGAVFVQFLGEYLRVFGRYYMVIFGVVLISTLRFTPGGAVALGRQLADLWARRRHLRPPSDSRVDASA
jgi:branched-chain amino acid transport system permease protein